MQPKYCCLYTPDCADGYSYMQDLIGRRYVALVGGSSLCLGIILLASAKHFAQGVVGMGFAGAGAAVGELTALAGYFSHAPLSRRFLLTPHRVAELVPVKKRGAYLAVVTACVLPFCPYLLYSQLLSTYHTWRWGIWICLYVCQVDLVNHRLKLFKDLERHLSRRSCYSVLP